MSDRKNIRKEQKQEVIKSFVPDKKDSGCVEVQVAILTLEIKSLTEHLKIHKKDFSSRKGLLIKVGRRRSLLDYLKKKSQARYEALIKKLELRK
jgi:small subunit ribosomal protein S15